MIRFVLGYCRCGCGTQIPILSRHTGKTLARFVFGHHRRGRHFPNEDYSSRSGKNNVRWNGGKSRHTAGYIRILSPDHPNHDHQGYVFEHRLVMEQHLGRYLTVDEVVHHINGNKHDNRIENLQLMTKKEHRSHHGKKDTSDRKCCDCGTDKPGLSKEGWTRWSRNPLNKEEWFCHKCYNRQNYHKLRLRI